MPDTVNDLSLIYPGGGMISTPTDLLRFVIALENGDLLSKNSIDLMLGKTGETVSKQQPAGLGWNAWQHESHGRILSRVGGQSGCSALLLSYADRGVTVALVANLARLDPIWELTNELMGIGLSAKQEVAVP